MTVRAVIGFHHLPFALAGWAAYSDHGITTPSGITVPDATGGIMSNGTAAYTYENINIPMARYMVAPVAKIYVGVRITILKATRNTSQVPVSIHVNGDGGLGKARSLGRLDDLLGVAANTAQPANKVIYAEFCLTADSQIVERRVNGVAIASVTLTSQVSRNPIIVLEGAGDADAANINRTRWSDIYVNDDQGSNPGFLGPQVVTRLQLNATGTGWVTAPAGSTLTQAIAPPADTSGDLPAKLVATSPADKTPMTVALVSNLPIGAVASAIEITVGSSSTTAGQTKTSASLKKGTDTLAGADIVGPASGTYLYNNLVGVYPASPGGAAWTPEAINATSLILTPDA